MSYNDEAFIRPGLEALNKLAKRADCTIIFVHHWNKNTSVATQLRAGGSASFAQIVRHRLSLAWHGPTEGGEGAFEISKSNIGPRGHVHGYEVAASAEYDTAVFRLTEPLLVPDLHTWMEQREAAARDIEIDTDDDDESEEFNRILDEGKTAREAATEVREQLTAAHRRGRKRKA